MIRINETIVATANTLRGTINLDEAENFLIENFLWNNKEKEDQLLEGLASIVTKQSQEIKWSSPETTASSTTDGFRFELVVKSEERFHAAVSELQTDMQTFRNRLHEKLKPFMDKRSDWDRAFRMTLHAHGLIGLEEVGS